jgi:hypothetical protein
MSDRYLEQSINITFSVKLQNNACNTFAVLSEKHGWGAMRKASVFEWHKRLKQGRENVLSDENNSQNFLQYEGHRSSRIYSMRPNSKVSLLCGSTKAVT